MAESFTQQYNSLLKRLEEQMFNTSSILDMLNRQFGWVSSLANNTKDGIFSVKGVRRPEFCQISIASMDNSQFNTEVRILNKLRAFSHIQTVFIDVTP